MRFMIGNGDVLAQMIFVQVNPSNLNAVSTGKLLSNIFSIADAQIMNGAVKTYVAFIEKTSEVKPNIERQTIRLQGRVEWRTLQDVEGVLKEKKKHADAAFRKAGHVSTHPPKFLTATTLTVVIGSLAFLLECVDLFLERDGPLGKETFDLLKKVAVLKPFTHGSRQDCYVEAFIKDRAWYSGNAEQLAHIAHMKRMTSEEFLERIGNVT